MWRPVLGRYRSSGLRIPSGRGLTLKTFVPQDTSPDELLAAVMAAVLADVGLSPDKLGDVCVGERTEVTSPIVARSRDRRAAVCLKLRSVETSLVLFV